MTKTATTNRARHLPTTYRALVAMLPPRPIHDDLDLANATAVIDRSVFAAANIQYAAETLGLGTCCIGFITGPVNADKGLKKLVGLPADHKVQTSLIVGYPQFKYARSVPKSKANVTFRSAP